MRSGARDSGGPGAVGHPRMAQIQAIQVYQVFRVQLQGSKTLSPVEHFPLQRSHRPAGGGNDQAPV